MKIIVKDLAVERGGRRVLDGVSFHVAQGEALILTGANGAGKTTLLRAVAGFLPPVHGSIRLEGGDGEQTLAEQAHSIGHSNAVKPQLSVRENIEFWRDYLGGGDSSAIDNALAQFALQSLAELPVAYLSAGQKRRVGLARLLAAKRPVWLLDEPTVSLDADSSKLLSNAVNVHTAKGGLAIIATHLPLGLERARELKLDAARRAA